jgi:undecaprenyl-diphosphatase
MPPTDPRDDDPRRRGPSPIEERIGERDLGRWPTETGRRLVRLVDRVATVLGHLLRWSRANTALVVTVVVGGLVVLALDLFAAEVYDAVTEGEGLQTLDRPVLDAAVRLRTPARDTAVTAFTDLGGALWMTVIVVVITSLLAARRRSWTPVVLMAVAATGSVLMTVAGKDLVGRARPPATLAVPPLETSPAFPSGHTLNATVLVGMAAYLVLLGARRVWVRVLVVVAAAGFVVAMGLSRVYLGHHWLTDVVAGWLLGLGWLATVVTGHRVQITLRRPVPDATADQPVSAARPASSRATGTRNGEQET